MYACEWEIVLGYKVQPNTETVCIVVFPMCYKEQFVCYTTVHVTAMQL